MAEGLDDDRRNQTGTASLARLSVGQLVGLQVAPQDKGALEFAGVVRGPVIAV